MAIFGRKVMNIRITILGIVVLFLLSLDVARIFYLQVLKGDEYAAKAESQQLSDTEIPAMRGTIYDSDGNILAQSATVWTVYLDPLNIKEKQRPVLIAELTKLFDLDEEEAKALEEKTRQKNHYVIVREQVENNIKKQLADFIDKQAMANCIGMEQSTKRYYPYGSLASSVIGFTGADDQGLSGLEQNYNDPISLAHWMMYGMPLTLILLPLCWFLLTKVLFRKTMKEIEGGAQWVQSEFNKLGPIG